jgi:hypothetical protein
MNVQRCGSSVHRPAVCSNCRNITCPSFARRPESNMKFHLLGFSHIVYANCYNVSAYILIAIGSMIVTGTKEIGRYMDLTLCYGSGQSVVSFTVPLIAGLGSMSGQPCGI